MAPNIEDMSCYKMLPEHKISLPKVEYNIRDPIKAVGSGSGKRIFSKISGSGSVFFYIIHKKYIF
jgi:hypothetical protein